MKRSTPMQRTGFARPEPTKEPKRRTRKCKCCRTVFELRNSFDKFCDPACEKIQAQLDEKNEQKAIRQAGLRELRDRDKKFQTKATQTVFNTYIRLRDRLAGHCCISSGRPLDWSGNAVDAGHYRSVGSAPHLRFNEDNVHAQSKHDNQYKSGNAVDYRIRLIQRIGLERVEALEADDKPKHYTIDDLKAIKSYYQQQIKQLKEKM